MGYRELEQLKKELDLEGVVDIFMRNNQVNVIYDPVKDTISFEDLDHDTYLEHPVNHD